MLTCYSDYADQVWIWENEDGSTFYFDIGEVVRFRVEIEEWHDQIPNAPDLGDAAAIERKPPYSIIVWTLCPVSDLLTNDTSGINANGWPGTYILVVTFRKGHVQASWRE